MSFETIFADVATQFTAVFGGPYFEAVARWPGTPVYDDGGSIVTPATPVELPCQVQIDAATEAMRRDAAFRETDVRLLVLAASIDGAIDTNAVVTVLSGPNAGKWSVESVMRDPAGILFDCRGRKVS